MASLLASDNGGSRGQPSCRLPSQCTKNVTANPRRAGRDKPHAIYWAPVLAQQSHLRRLSSEPWCRPSFMAGMVGAREKKKKRGGHLSVVQSGQLVDAGGKQDYRSQKHARGVFASDIWLAPFMLLLPAFLLSSHIFPIALNTVDWTRTGM